MNNILINKDFPEIRIDNTELLLTKKEFDLFILLWEHKGKVCTPSFIKNKIWGGSYHENGRIVDSLITRLRKKIKRYINIVNRKGFGYLIV